MSPLLGSPAAEATNDGPPPVAKAYLMGATSTLELRFDHPEDPDALLGELDEEFDWISAEQAADVLTIRTTDPNPKGPSAGTTGSTSPRGRTEKPRRLSPADVGTSATPEDIYCDRSYFFSDSNGRYTVQRACGVQKAPWSFTLSQTLQAICVGLFSEGGMHWTKNGATMPQMSPHLEACSYIFHGTYGVGAGDRVSYTDDFAFRHDLRSGGDARVHIVGYWKFRNSG
jgi:hypothetical protein